MVEQDAAGAKNVVALAVVHGHPVGVELGHAVGAARVKRRGFFLRNGLHFAKHFRGAGLVEADFRVHQANGFEQVQCTQASDLCGGAGLLKAHAHKALRGQVVNLGGLHLLHQGDAGAQVGEVVFDQVQLGVLLDAQLVDAPEIHRAGATVSAIDGVALVEQQLRQVGAVLAGDAGDQGGFVHEGAFPVSKNSGLLDKNNSCLRLLDAA